MNTTHFSGLDGFVWFIGVVEDNNDPDKLGRVKVRAYGHHTNDLSNIPLEYLPWATVMAPTNDTSMQGVGNFSTMKPGTWVVGFFLDAEEKQQPVVMGTLRGKPGSGPNKNLGFSDPSEINPQRKKWSGHGTLVDKDGNNFDYSTDKQHIESDINRLARNETVTWEGEDVSLAHSILQTKEDARTKEVPIANEEKSIGGMYIEADGKWDEPASTYAAVYPNNNVRETYGKNIKEYDDTDGATRIHEIHGESGTFYEIDHKGNKVTRITGDNYEVIAGSDFVNVKGDVNLTIDSNCNTYVKGNWNIQVDGNVVENIKGTYDQNVTGDATMDAKTINLNNGTKGAARLDDQVDTGDDPAGISGSDGSNKIESASKTVIIGD